MKLDQKRATDFKSSVNQCKSQSESMPKIYMDKTKRLQAFAINPHGRYACLLKDSSVRCQRWDERSAGHRDSLTDR